MYFCQIKIFAIMKRITLLLFSLILLLFSHASFAQKDKGIAIVGFYNLENLFDTENDPLTNDEQFLPEGSYRWTPERYQKKLHNMSRVLADIGIEYGGLVAVGVSEIENERVLRDLISTDNLRDRNWGIVHYDSPDRRGVDVGLLYDKSRIKVFYSHAFRLYTPDTNFRTRDQLLVQAVLDDIDTISFIVNHWPSKLGGAKSVVSREAAAKLTRSIVDTIVNKNPKAKVVIMGDFNDEPNSKSILKHLNTKKKISQTNPKDIYNPMYAMYRSGIGSYAYRDNWSLIDQIMVTYGLLKPAPNSYKFISAHVYRNPMIMLKTQTGSFEDYPFRTFAGGVYQGGYSDHFPVYIILKR